MPRKSKWDKSNHNARGPMKQADIEYIYANAGIKSDEDIAAHLKRTPEKIREIRIRHQALNKQGSIDVEDAIRLREALYAEPEWELIKKSMNREELAVFEKNYMDLMRQFNGDVFPTERKQIISLLNTQIRLIRINLEDYRAEKESARFGILLEEELDKPVDERNEDKIKELHALVNGCSAASKARSDQYKTLTDKFEAGIKGLKGAREQRIQKAVENKESAIGLLKQLSEEDAKKSVMLEQFIMGEGVKSEKKRLAEYHTYMDGRVDKPVLDSETV
jgi:hypothetical protein